MDQGSKLPESTVESDLVKFVQAVLGKPDKVKPTSCTETKVEAKPA